MAAVNLALKQYTYKRHRPEETVLYRAVETYWPLFVKEQARVGKKLPLFIHREFEEFLKCGLPEHGFVRTFCAACHYSGVVAFSCKTKSFCPSCLAKRMNNEAYYITKYIIPEVPTRQWVISFPWKLRYLLAHNAKLTNHFLKIFINTLDQFQRKRSGFSNSKTGSVTVIQKFGSALQLTVHFHTLMTDGVYVPLKNGSFEFLRLSPPTHEDLQEIAFKIKTRVERKLKRLGLTDNDADQLGFDEESLGELSKLSVENKAGFGERQGKTVQKFGTKNYEVDPEDNDLTTANIDGFSLNARVWIAAGERERLEQVIRYMARGPIANERLTESFPNQFTYELKSKWRDGTTHVGFTGLDLMARIVALIPPPKMKMIRYFGVFASNFKGREKIVPEQELIKSEGPVDLENPKVKKERLSWSQMLKRVFEIDVTICPKCQGRMEQIAVIKDKAVALAILKSLDEITVFKPLTVEPVRGPPDAASAFADELEVDQRQNDW